MTAPSLSIELWNTMAPRMWNGVGRVDTFGKTGECARATLELVSGLSLRVRRMFRAVVCYSQHRIDGGVTFLPPTRCCGLGPRSDYVARPSRPAPTLRPFASSSTG